MPKFDVRIFTKSRTRQRGNYKMDDRKALSVEAAALAFAGMVALICLGALFGAFYL